MMSFNIRYGSADDGDHHWEKRRPRVVDRIRAFDPDLLGLQECEDGPQAAYLKQALPDYAFIGYRREGGGSTAREMAPVLYKRAAFEAVAVGRFWLSETPDIEGSVGWGAQFARTVTWARLRRRGSPDTLVFASTHFDLIPAAIEASAGLLADWARETARLDPLIVVGDFNAEKGSSAYLKLTGGGMRDAHPRGAAEGTYHEFGHLASPRSIDWILVSAQFAIESAGIDSSSRDGRYPSDHYPVTAVARVTGDRA